MGVYASKSKSKSKSKMINGRNLCDKRVGEVMEKAVFLQKEVKEMVHEREKGSKGCYERDMMVFAFKEAEWKQERKRLREEVKRLRKMVEEKEDKIRGMGQQESEKGQALMLSTSFMVEQMREERARRDEAVEKWKQLYLAIKTELDHLIQRTDRGGDAQYWRAEEEDMIEELQKEVVAKEETIKALKAQVASIEHEDYRKEREIDILRQSLRIMSSKKMASRATSKNLP
ncbi:hypothetical protein FH972_014837 [Carpinus fangiana]|uniref:Uncharacterized protein n=1 Tax=Carpinus fangiana TaxID=176857 RepID=A0A5N6RAY0_9ROSI|nr:hypothetical protein FH972_014837 [Carpinus fangiana]